MNKNILFFISSLDGGAENQLYKLFKLLQTDNNTRYLVAKEKKSNSTIIGLDKKKSMFGLFGLINQIIKFKPDILFTTLPTPNFLNALLRKLNFFKYKSVCRIANYNIDLKTTKFIIKNSDIIFFNSKENLGLYAAHFPKDRDKFIYLNNIVNGNKEKIKKSTLNPKIKAIIASRLVENKGIDLAVKAFNEISNENIFLDIFGEGKEINNLKKISKNPNVSFKGYSNNLNNLWESYNLFLLPSRKEGLSNALLEAQFYNIYSIVSNCKTGNREIVELTNNGICFKTGDYLDLKNCILRFYRAELRYNESQKIISENFSSDKAFDILRRTLAI